MTHFLAGLNGDRTLADISPEADLAAPVGPTTPPTPWLAPPQPRMQRAAGTMICSDVLIDPLMAGEAGASGNLFRAVVLAQEGFDQPPALHWDPWAAAGDPPAPPRASVGPLSMVSALVGVPTKLP